MKLNWHVANDKEFSGYGFVGGMLRQHLARHPGVEMLNVDQFGWDLIVSVSPPRAFVVGPYDHRPDLVLHTMFEAEPVPPNWIDVMNRAGLIWSPSRYCAALFAAYGVRTPICVSGYGFDPLTFQPVSRKARDSKLKVIVWGDNLASRKNLLAAIQTYMWADLPDAELDIKINDSTFQGRITAKEDGVERQDIRVITSPMPRHELIEWLERADVLIYLSGGEGYGCIPLEAMAMGLPVIAMRNTGMIDYMQPDCILEVPSKGRMLARTLHAVHKIPMTIEQPDIEAAVTHLRWVAANRDAADALGQRAAASVAHLTWEAAAKNAYTLLDEFVQTNISLLHQTSVVY